MRILLVAGLAVVAALGVAPLARGQGRGRSGGLGSAASRAGVDQEATSPGLGKATQGFSRLGGGVNRAAGSNRAPGLAKGGVPKRSLFQGSLGKGPESEEVESTREKLPNDSTARYQKQLDIEQRNLEQRLAQAQKLRQQAEQNGNTELTVNADRIEAAAIKHYEERVEQVVSKFGPAEPTLAPPSENFPTRTRDTLGDETPIGSDLPSLGDARNAASDPEPKQATQPWWKPKWFNSR
jgi:hypothetical protein